jgi:hypothetical protein
VAFAAAGSQQVALQSPPCRQVFQEFAQRAVAQGGVGKYSSAGGATSRPLPALGAFARRCCITALLRFR